MLLIFISHPNLCVQASKRDSNQQKNYQPCIYVQLINSFFFCLYVHGRFKYSERILSYAYGYVKLKL